MTDVEEIELMRLDWQAASRRLRKQVVDQLAHFLIAAALVVTFQPGGGLIGAAGLGLVLGLVRETGQHGTLRLWALGWGSRLDLLFWTLGGLVGGAL